MQYVFSEYFCLSDYAAKDGLCGQTAPFNLRIPQEVQSRLFSRKNKNSSHRALSPNPQQRPETDDKLKIIGRTVVLTNSHKFRVKRMNRA